MKWKSVNTSEFLRQTLVYWLLQQTFDDRKIVLLKKLAKFENAIGENSALWEK